METPPRDTLDDKVNSAFSGKVVRKDLVRNVKVGANVPVFVLEFLLGKYCASTDPIAIEMGVRSATTNKNPVAFIALHKAGAPQQVRDHVKALIDAVGGDGAYILSTGAVLDGAEADNLHAMIDTCKLYGRY